MIKLVMVDIRCWDKSRAWASGESCACKLIMGLEDGSNLELKEKYRSKWSLTSEEIY
jgi:hypothetical protein